MVRKVTRIAAVSFILCFVFCLAAAPLSTQAFRGITVTPVAFTYRWIEFGSGQVYIQGNLLIVLDTPHLGEVSGEFVGTTNYDTNTLIYDMVALSGRGYGLQTFDVEYDGKTGQFVGHIHFKLIGDLFAGTFTVSGRGTFRGTGEFSGMWLVCSLYAGIGEPTSVEGHIVQLTLDIIP